MIYRALLPPFLVAFAGAFFVNSSVLAIDLTVASLEVNQAVQYGSTKLIGNNVTWVRAMINTNGFAISGVDATLRVSVNGVPQAAAPVYSLNGPFTAPASPSNANLNDTINFAVIAPVSNSVTFTVEVNPNRSVVESNYSNNTLSVTKPFECRRTLEVAYVPINYSYNGAGLPISTLMEPGIGDGFLRAIYHPNEWNYHISPTPPLAWNTYIEDSHINLLNTLHDIRLNQIPQALPGYASPDFVYGWLPGNPYSGNGETIGIPGDVCFGNTDPARLQRTFAHEMGHAFGRLHNINTINTNGVDIERHLKDTQDLAQLFPTSKNDVMVAGLMTNQAWVWQGTYDAVHNDARMACNSVNQPVMVPLLRISGVIDNATRALKLDRFMRIPAGRPTLNDPDGDTTVIAINAAGQELMRTTVNTKTNLESCTDPDHGRTVANAQASLYVTLPETMNGDKIQQIKILDRPSGKYTATVSRSPHAPLASLTNIGVIVNGRFVPAANVNGAIQLSGHVRVEWTAQDDDGDSLIFNLLYSPDDGASWLPLVVNSGETFFEFDSNQIPASGNSLARFQLIASDGMNITTYQTSGYQFMVGNPPLTYLLTPNTGDIFPQKAPIAFHAASWDLEDKMLTGGQITWTSNIDGNIGTGQLFMNSSLSPGNHIITVKGTDSTSLFTTKQISITVTPRTVVSPDCNNNGVLDSVDIANGTSSDSNANGIPDECEPHCASDITHNNIVNVDDLLAVINAWGPCAGVCPPNCPPDITHNCIVNVDDLLAVINAWGPCH